MLYYTRQTNEICRDENFSSEAKSLSRSHARNLIKMQISILWVRGFSFCGVGLATIGVCVFCASASVGALFLLIPFPRFAKQTAPHHVFLHGGGKLSFI